MSSSVISVQLDDNDEIEYMDMDEQKTLQQPLSDDQLDADEAYDDHEATVGMSAAANADAAASIEPDHIGDVIDHDPGAELDAVMEGQPSDDDNDDDDERTVLVPNEDGSMTIKRQERPVVEHLCVKCQKTYKSAASLKRHTNLCRHVPLNAEVAHRLKRELNRPVTSTRPEDVLPNECFCCYEDKASAHVGFMACNFCPKSFKSHINLERHLFTLHAPTAEFACTVCNATCVSESIYQLHVESHDEGKPFACDKCGKEFTRKYHLDRHAEFTECDPNRQKKRLPCNVCNKQFTRLDNLREHLRSHMGKAQRRKDYQCPYCEKCFYGSSLLNIHIRTHTGERPFPCDLCTMWFPSNGALRKHRRTHTGEKPYECSECGKHFSVKETLNRHMKIHTGDRKHACTFCDKTFIQAQQLKAHLFYHTGENGFDCDQCSRRFNKRSRLDAHIKTAHELGDSDLVCDVCQAKFRFKGKLAKHLREHIREAKLQAMADGGGAKVKQEKVTLATPRVKKEKIGASRAAPLMEIEEVRLEEVWVAEPEPVAKRERKSTVALTVAAAEDEDEDADDSDLDAEWQPKKTVRVEGPRNNGRAMVTATAVRVKKEPGLSRPPTTTKTPPSEALKSARIKTIQTQPASKSAADGEPVYPCDHCERVFTRKGPLAMHMKTHKRDVNVDVANADDVDTSVASAGETTESESPSKKSISPTKKSTTAAKPPSDGKSPQAKGGAKRVTCKLCKQQLSDLDALVRHMKKHHREFFAQMFADEDDDDDDDDNNDDNDDRDSSDENNAEIGRNSIAKGGKRNSTTKSVASTSNAANKRTSSERNNKKASTSTTTAKTTGGRTQTTAAPVEPEVAAATPSEDDDGVMETEFEVELIQIKDEDEDDAQTETFAPPLAPTVVSSLSPHSPHVDELPAGGLTVTELTDNIGKLLELLVDEQTLSEMGWPSAPCKTVLVRVIEQCNQTPADSRTCPDEASELRENAKLLFTSLISNDSIRSLLNNHTVDEVIVHVLKLGN